MVYSWFHTATSFLDIKSGSIDFYSYKMNEKICFVFKGHVKT